MADCSANLVRGAHQLIRGRLGFDWLVDIRVRANSFRDVYRVGRRLAWHSWIRFRSIFCVVPEFDARVLHRTLGEHGKGKGQWRTTAAGKAKDDGRL